MTRIFALLLAALLVAAPAADADEAPDFDGARRLLSKTPVIDGHNDLAWALRTRFAGDFAKADLATDLSALAPPPGEPPLMTDIPRLREGGVGAQFWSVWIPAAMEGEAAAETVREQIVLVKAMVGRYPEAFELAASADDVVRIQKAGRIASMIGMEGGAPIKDSLADLRRFRALGVSYMTLAHSKTTTWVDSATDAPKHGGLSPFGESVVREMNRIGMMVDLSHVSADAMRDAISVSSAPVMFSHSSAFAITPHPRNVPDDVLALLPANGGVVMVNFYPTFVSEDHRQWAAARAGERARQSALFPGDPEQAAAGVRLWELANPRPVAAVKHVADHIEHVARVAGHDHVGLGADFDGIDVAPWGLSDVGDYPALFAELKRRGWSDRNLQKLAGQNILRVMRAVEKAAIARAR